MKRLSLKIKLTMIFTLLMTGVICGVLALLFSLSSQELLSGVQSRLEQEVAGARDDIVFQNGKLKFDSDLLDLDHGVYLSVYSSDGTFFTGKSPIILIIHFLLWMARFAGSREGTVNFFLWTWYLRLPVMEWWM